VDQAHIEKLRRFALAVGLIVLTRAVAGISFAEGATVTVLGIPFRVARPDLLPFGFAAAAAYGALRFHYYAIMLATSPYRQRSDLLDSLQLHEAKAKSAMGPRDSNVLRALSQIPLHDHPKVRRVKWLLDALLFLLGEKMASFFRERTPCYEDHPLRLVRIHP
jgi:hypothetical protein